MKNTNAKENAKRELTVGEQMRHRNIPNVYAAITGVTADLSIDGIGKNNKNTQQGYAFRGIDDVYNELSPVLAKHKLCILPRVLSRTVTERRTAKGGALFCVVLDVEFDLISSEDGSKHTIAVIGEAMDSGDKATNKAMSAAYKYAAMQAFCIPVQGNNDADSETHEVAPASKDKQTRDIYTRLSNKNRELKSAQEHETFWKLEAVKSAFEGLPDDWKIDMARERDEKKASFEEPDPFVQ